MTDIDRPIGPAEIVARLETCAAGRREYAENAPDDQRAVLLTQAAAFDNAARAELAQPRTLTHADLPRVYDLCARVCGAEDATVAGHFLL